MRPLFRFIPNLALATCLCAASPHVAFSAQPSPATTPELAQKRLDERRAWAVQVRELRARERADLDSLSRSLAQLPPGAELARAQRDLEDAKRAWRRRMLAAQLVRAQSVGTPGNAARLRARLSELDERSIQRATAKANGGER